MSWGNPQTWQEKTVAAVLAPASMVYGIGSFIRLKGYSTGAVKQKRLPVPVISVGNLTCGGTGKTPVTADLAARLVSQGRKVAVLSRGYNRLSKDEVVIASDGQRLLAASTECGDEPYLIASRVPEAVVIVGKRRTQTGQIAISQYGCDVILLDDGFQHLPIHRDSDVVLLDYNDELLNDRLLPAGRLREPLAALSRASWVVITKIPVLAERQRLLDLKELIRRYSPSSTITSCRLTTSSACMFSDLASELNQTALGVVAGKGDQPAAELLANKKVVAFSGIARPDAFLSELKNLNAQLVADKSFADHHWYQKEDIDELKELVGRHQADLVVTTEKDAVRLKPSQVGELPLAILRQKVEWLGPIPLPDAQPVAAAKQ